MIKICNWKSNKSQKKVFSKTTINSVNFIYKNPNQLYEDLVKIAFNDKYKICQ